MTDKQIEEAEGRLKEATETSPLPWLIGYSHQGRISHIHDAPSAAYVESLDDDSDEILDYSEPLVTTDGGHYGPPISVAQFWVEAPNDLRLALDEIKRVHKVLGWLKERRAEAFSEEDYGVHQLTGFIISHIEDAINGDHIALKEQ